MRRLFVLSLIILLGVNYLSAQFSDDNVTLTVTGLSDTYAEKFKSKKHILIEALNVAKLPSELQPILVQVVYKDNDGFVFITTNFDLDIIGEGTKYESLSSQFQSFGNGISFFLPKQLLNVLSEYKYSVALDGYSIRKDIAGFQSGITLLKKNGDKVGIFGYNKLNSQGFYPDYFFEEVSISIAGKKYETNCANLKTLNDFAFFYTEDLEGLDGKKTGAFYFNKFFGLPTE